ncbi:hypothetical protein [Desulfomonile tiedjei]|uniref:Uncharacterized protein n=1 Tax=Desulfomonile tiedjei (strain ATCC 49306 / DSM 6799 / DCB-1) TaxID=706587 RepID=I4C917_DESTA|nr:hypothetical protein [Desulfomonile tiedjei]AFM26058.1 hypothetical protein Desti_3404 [Desulfomonile tiedjei DSM 6799]
MLVCQIGILILACWNFVVNHALGLMILLRRPYGVWPRPVARHDLKLNEKGELPNEETVV